MMGCSSDRGRALETDELWRLVDVIHELGAVACSRYITGPLMALTGARKPLGEIVEALP